MTPKENDERIDVLEKEFKDFTKIVYTIQASLSNIEKYMIQNSSVKDTTIIHSEKIKVTEARLLDLENNEKETRKTLNGINLKIAGFSGVVGVIIFLINKFF